MTFTANTEELIRYGNRLGDLSEEFRNIEDDIGDYRDAVGVDNIMDALDEFADNWSHKRGQLAGALDELSEAATSAGEAYCNADQEIAEGVRGGGS